MSETLYRVRAYTHMNLAGNLVDMLPPGENRVVESDPVTQAKARRLLPEWMGVCQDRWRVVIEPADQPAKFQKESP